MIDKTRNEALAIEYGALRAGEIVNEAISQGLGTDLAQWTPDVWHAMVEAAITGFVERMQELKNVPESA